jgi:hypothetical protein
MMYNTAIDTLLLYLDLLLVPFDILFTYLF